MILAGDDFGARQKLWGVPVKFVDFVVDGVDKTLLFADTAAEGETFRVEQHLQIENLDCDAVSIFIKRVQYIIVVFFNQFKNHFVRNFVGRHTQSFSANFLEGNRAHVISVKIFIADDGNTTFERESDFARAEM